MKIGLFFVSRYAFDKYNPTIPVHRSCTPPKDVIIHTREGQPATGSPTNNALIIITSKRINDKKQITIPMTDTIDRGVVEKAIIPSKA